MAAYILSVFPVVLCLGVSREGVERRTKQMTKETTEERKKKAAPSLPTYSSSAEAMREGVGTKSGCSSSEIPYPQQVRGTASGANSQVTCVTRRHHRRSLAPRLKRHVPTDRSIWFPRVKTNQRLSSQLGVGITASENASDRRLVEHIIICRMRPVQAMAMHTHRCPSMVQPRPRSVSRQLVVPPSALPVPRM